MRYRLMATYRGVPYEVGAGPSPADVVLYAACPPPEELGFEPATGHWRKRVIRAEIDGLWESRPVGVFRGEPCIVLDDLGDRLHIAYLGMEASRALRLGYWQIDRGVFELLAFREDVTGLTEERIERPLTFAQPLSGQTPVAAYPYGSAPTPPVPFDPSGQLSTGQPETNAHENGGRSARRQRVATRDIFGELADLAAIPRSAYTLEGEVDGTLCLLPTVDGFEVFMAAAGARHEVRSFPDEESAYFYLFGVLAAEAVRNGWLARTDAARGGW